MHQLSKQNAVYFTHWNIWQYKGIKYWYMQRTRMKPEMLCQVKEDSYKRRHHITCFHFDEISNRPIHRHRNWTNSSQWWGEWRAEGEYGVFQSVQKAYDKCEMICYWEELFFWRWWKHSNVSEQTKSYWIVHLFSKKKKSRDTQSRMYNEPLQYLLLIFNNHIHMLTTLLYIRLVLRDYH